VIPIPRNRDKFIEKLKVHAIIDPQNITTVNVLALNNTGAKH